MPLKTLSAIFFKGGQRKGRSITVHGCTRASRIPGRFTRGQEDQHVGVHTGTGLPWYPGHCAFSEDRRTKPEADLAPRCRVHPLAGRPTQSLRHPDQVTQRRLRGGRRTGTLTNDVEMPFRSSPVEAPALTRRDYGRDD